MQHQRLNLWEHCEFRGSRLPFTCSALALSRMLRMLRLFLVCALLSVVLSSKEIVQPFNVQPNGQVSHFDVALVSDLLAHLAHCNDEALGQGKVPLFVGGRRRDKRRLANEPHERERIHMRRRTVHLYTPLALGLARDFNLSLDPKRHPTFSSKTSPLRSSEPS